jgi:hypothetical protein
LFTFSLIIYQIGPPNEKPMARGGQMPAGTSAPKRGTGAPRGGPKPVQKATTVLF